MKNLDSTLLCLEIDSTALGYRVLKSISDPAGIRILEASQVGKRFVILALGETNVLNERLKFVEAELVEVRGEVAFRSALIEKIPTQVVEAVYNLPSQQAEESLIVVEADSVGELLSIARTLIDESRLSVIEIRIHRDGTGAHGVFTGSVSGCRDALTQAKRQIVSGRVELIENLSSSFRRFFNLSGEEA
jgi:hypothetical protein